MLYSHGPLRLQDCGLHRLGPIARAMQQEGPAQDDLPHAGGQQAGSDGDTNIKQEALDQGARTEASSLASASVTAGTCGDATPSGGAPSTAGAEGEGTQPGDELDLPGAAPLDVTGVGQPRRPQRAAASHRIPANVLIGADPADLAADSHAQPGAPPEPGSISGATSWHGAGAGPSAMAPRALKTNLVSGGPCVECQAVKSTLFRKTPDGQPLCNACGLRLAREMQKQHSAGAASDGGVGSQGSPPYGGAGGRSRGISKMGPGARGRRRKLPPDGRRKCAICGATNSPQWRHIPEEDMMACNACALRRYRNQGRNQATRATVREHSP
jgi:GATA zinc finger